MITLERDEVRQRTFFGRALERIAAAFNVSRAPADAEIVQSYVSPAKTNIIDLAAAARTITDAKNTAAIEHQNMIGMPMVEGALARLPVDPTPTLSFTFRTLPDAFAAKEAAVPTPAERNIFADVKKPSIDDILPHAKGADIIFFADTPSIEHEDTTAERVEQQAAPAPAPRAFRPLAAQLLTTAKLNRPKRKEAKVKRTAPQRHVALMVRHQMIAAPAPAARFEAPAAPVRSDQRQEPAHEHRRIDFSIPAVRGALRLEREGRNEIVSLPMAA
jgi:hypothetical protein